MKGRMVLCLMVAITTVLLLSCLLAGCGGTAGEEATGEEVAQPKEGDITSYEGGYRFDYNGWVYLHIEGDPYERGFQHGYLMASELAETMDMVKYTTLDEKYDARRRNSGRMRLIPA